MLPCRQPQQLHDSLAASTNKAEAVLDDGRIRRFKRSEAGILPRIQRHEMEGIFGRRLNNSLADLYEQFCLRSKPEDISIEISQATNRSRTGVRHWRRVAKNQNAKHNDDGNHTLC